MFMNYFDAHEPYLPPPPFDKKFSAGRAHGRLSQLHRWLWDVSEAHRPMSAEEVREEHDAYDSSLAYLDDQVGRLLSELERRQVLQHTVVVITSDHGEELGEHGLFDHGNSLYRTALQVPLVIAGPGIPRGRRFAEAVSLRDVAATIVTTAGLGAGAHFPGRSLVSDERNAETRRSPVLSELSRTSGQPDWFPVSKGDMKALLYQRNRCIQNGDRTYELYDVASDPWERHDLAPLANYRAVLDECRRRLDQLARGQDEW